VSSIETDTFLAAPPQRVCEAITDPAQLAAWLMPNDFAPQVGHRFTFRTDPVPAQGFDGVIRCEVLELQAPELLRISWVSSGLDSTVTWRLAAEGTGTRLFLTHDGFDDADPRQQVTRRILGGGWRGHLVRRLEDLLAAG
jgi:uncharacterized protein YndB with AHSA1/START domain